MTDCGKVEHKIVFEFYSEENGAISDEPLSFTVPVELLHHHSNFTPSTAQFLRRDYAQLCFESGTVRAPVVVDNN